MRTYKAIHAQTGQEIVILSPQWSRRIDALREMDHADLLVCQGCRQPLRVKAGELKRAHFAHKHLQACSYGSQSLEILEARAVLYDWLLAQFGEQVTVEKQVEGGDLPRPVDCWVETPAGTFAYWIIEAGIKLEPREAILATFARLGVKIQYVFLSPMLREEKKEFHSLLLTPTERAFLQQTPYDGPFSALAEPGSSIHYLDTEAPLLITFRGLRLFHRPNWFKGVKKSAAMETVRAHRLDGGFVYPGETDRLDALRQKQVRLERKRQRYEDRHAVRQGSVDQPAPLENKKGDPQPVAGDLPKVSHAWSAARSEEAASEQESELPEALPCAICGQVTRDYWSTFYDSTDRKLCRCRDCLDQGRFG